MFRPAAASAKSAKGGGGDSSQSDSDWDTTVDFPAGDGNANNTDDDDLPVQPKPKTRVTLADKEKEEKISDGTSHSARGEKASSANKRNLKTPASASGVRLSTFDSDSRENSPVPPFNFGFGDAKKKNTDSNRGSPVTPSSAGKARKDNRYEMSPTPKIPASMEVPLPKWDDSDAEQQTLEELRNTLKKEKIRESGNKTTRKLIQEGGDNSMATEHYSSVMENHRQGKEDATADNHDQIEKEENMAVQGQKTGASGFTRWLQKDGAGTNAMPLAENVPYRPFIVRDTDGKRFLYCFSEGSTAFYEVEEEESEAVMPKVADKVEGYIKRGWQEFFGILRIMSTVIIFMVVEALSFVTNHIARPLFLGVILTSGNRLVKPLLAGLFNLVLQPSVIFLWNMVSGLRHVSQPLIDILGALVTKIAVLVRAFRLVEVNLGSDYLHNRGVVGIDGGGGRSEVV